MSQLACSKCQGTRIIPGVRILDQGKGSDRSLQLVMSENPEALFFTGDAYGALKGNLCCDCGFVDLYCTENLNELWRIHKSHQPA